MGEKELIESLFQPFRRMNPGVEHLGGTLIEYRASNEEYRLHRQGNTERKALLDLS